MAALRNPPLPLLDMQGHPESHAAQFLVNLHTGAGWFYRQWRPEGLRAFGLHLAKEGAEIEADVIAGSLSALPVRPPPPSSNATAGALAAHKEKKEEYDDFMAASQAYLTWTIEQAGQTVAMALEEPDGTACLCTRKIALYVQTRWGGHSDRVMEATEQYLATVRFTDKGLFPAEVATLTKELRRLDNMKQGKSPLDQVRILERAVAHLPEARAGLAAYHLAVPGLAARRYSGMLEYIPRYYLHTTTMGEAFGGHAQTKMYTQAELDAAVAKRQQVAAPSRTYTQAEYTAAVAAAAKKPPKTPFAYKWCCEHGWNGHTTADCRVVQAAPASQYTTAQRNAATDPDGSKPNQAQLGAWQSARDAFGAIGGGLTSIAHGAGVSPATHGGGFNSQ